MEEDKVFDSLADIDVGGSYVQREDGKFVRAPADGGPGGAAGAASGDSPALPEDPQS